MSTQVTRSRAKTSGMSIFRGEEHDVRIKVAFFYTGDHCIEVISPIGAQQSTYSEFLSRNPTGGLHHIAYYSNDFDRTLAMLAEAARRSRSCRTCAHQEATGRSKSTASPTASTIRCNTNSCVPACSTAGSRSCAKLRRTGTDATRSATRARSWPQPWRSPAIELSATTGVAQIRDQLSSGTGAAGIPRFSRSVRPSYSVRQMPRR